jgi:hypothetical protein
MSAIIEQAAGTWKCATQAAEAALRAAWLTDLKSLHGIIYFLLFSLVISCHLPTSSRIHRFTKPWGYSPYDS